VNNRVWKHAYLLSGVAIMASSGFLVGTSFATPSVLIPADTTDIEQKSVGDGDLVLIEGDGVLSVDGVAINWVGPASELAIDNYGLIESVQANGRAIDTDNQETHNRNLRLINQQSGIIRADNDAIRYNSDLVDGNLIVDNYGLIESLNGGQAIDFNAIELPVGDTAAVEINNYSGGVIRSTGADAVRPGAGSVLTNAGLILSQGAPGEKNDAVDLQEHTAIVRNLNGGTISGQRHGITGDVHVEVYNAAGGLILGRNGSGVGSDGTGKVVNYGSIFGEFDGYMFGDGDGIDIDGYGEVDNYGLIEARGASPTKEDGRYNTAEGVLVTGGGYIHNHSTGIIRGVGSAITGGSGLTITNEGLLEGFYVLSLSDDVDVYNRPDGVISSPHGRAISATVGNVNVFNEGLLEGYLAVDLNTQTGLSNSVTNSGVIDARVWAITFGNGDDTLRILRGSEIKGIVNGGEGVDQLILEEGAVFDTALSFERLLVNGRATIIGDVSIDRSLISRQGHLFVEGVVDSLITVGAGGALSGSGFVGDVTVEADGMLISGTQNGGLTATGDVALLPGSRWIFEPGEDQSRVLIEGTLSVNGANLVVENWDRNAPLSTRYVIAETPGGVTGSFADLSVGMPFLSPILDTESGELAFRVGRNAVPFASFAQTANEAAAAAALDSLAEESVLGHAILFHQEQGLSETFRQLSGEVHAAVRATAQQHGRLPVSQVVQRLSQPTRKGAQLWVAGLSGSSSLDGDIGGAAIRRKYDGVVAGVEASLTERLRLGAAVSHIGDRMRMDSLLSHAEVNSTGLLAYGDITTSALIFRFGGYHSWVAVNTQRVVPEEFGGLVRAEYDSSVFGSFVEAAYPLRVGRGSIEPFVGFNVDRVLSDTFSEAEVVAALRGVKDRATHASSRKGASFTFPIGKSNVDLLGHAAWEYVLHGRHMSRTLRYDGSDDFVVRSTSFARNTGDLAIRARWAAVPGLSIEGGYAAKIGSRLSDHRGLLSLQLGL
jgi:subtilase-type serine protease